MVLMVDRSLSCSPFSVRISRHGGLREDSSSVPEEEIGVVDQRLSVESVVVHNNGPSELKTSSKTSDNKEDDPTVS
jgi:hypothetical protein